MTGVDVGEGAGDPVGGEAGVIPLRTCVRVLAPAADLNIITYYISIIINKD